MEKEQKLDHYELLYIISNKFSEDELGPINEKVKKILEKKQSQITYSEEWGKKRLAYPIKHQPYGYYMLFEFDAPQENLGEINSTLRITSEILRHQIVKKSVLTDIEKAKKAEDVSEKIKREMEEAKKIEKPKATKAKKVDLKDLDDKLEEILDVDDLL